MSAKMSFMISEDSFVTLERVCVVRMRLTERRHKGNVQNVHISNISKTFQRMLPGTHSDMVQIVYCYVTAVDSKAQQLESTHQERLTPEGATNAGRIRPWMRSPAT